MSSISVLGAGAFGTALAISLSTDREGVTLWARDGRHVKQMRDSRTNEKRLADCPFPNPLQITSNLSHACTADILLLALPMQKISNFVEANKEYLSEKTLVCCCKGVDLKTNMGPVELLNELVPTANVFILSGPSFAIDIASGLPTALTLSGRNEALLSEMQSTLTTPSLRLYSSHDPVGVELGGALKNVVAIACGIAIGAGLGESARAALMTRGYSEIKRLAVRLGADPDTLSGLAGFGDLTLTCTSKKSRNFSHGIKLGQGVAIDPEVTVEGVSTAQAVAKLSKDVGVEMPITCTVNDILTSSITISEAVEVLLSRPLTKETM